MPQRSPHELCLALIRADSEDEVVDLLRQEGYWDGDDVWRHYGDLENNWATIGNQQSRPEAALVEKLVNSVDACLIRACLEAGIHPERPEAPPTIKEAVARFFDPPSARSSSRAGLITDWSRQHRLQIARNITLAATGAKPPNDPCFTIVDCGEGQTPARFPTTLLSLHRNNKLNTPFVQGKFNMGGTGALRYCGKRNLQLVVSRRKPELVPVDGDRAGDWGFTVVRRRWEGTSTRNTVYSYLAPVGAESARRKGDVLSFAAPKLPIFPKGSSPYARESAWGTLIKLYEFRVQKRSHILRRDGLLGRLDLLLAEVALPVRLHECRLGYQGHEGSFANTLTGFRVRLDDNRADNLDMEPSSADLRVLGEPIRATIFAFKKDRAETYRSDEGVIFTVNGQTHGHLPTAFFRRKRVGMGYLRDSILVLVDCTAIKPRSREDLFMNSRDRLSSSELRYAIERELESLLRNHQGLRDLRERRRRKAIESRLAGDKPMEDVLRNVIKTEPALTQYLLAGTKLPNPFRPKHIVDEPFLGRRHPTFFHFKDEKPGKVLVRDCQVDRRARIAFETDAESEYFTRDADPGEFHLELEGVSEPGDYRISLHAGRANLHFELPPTSKPGDRLVLTATVTDPTLLNPLGNRAILNVVPKTETKPGPPPAPPGTAGLNLPIIIEVPEDRWLEQSPHFTGETALRLKHVGASDKDPESGDGPNAYDFYLNVDNVHLKRFLKHETQDGGDDAKLVKAQFRCGLVLLGLALIRQANGLQDDNTDDQNNLEDNVETFTSAAAAVLIPVIRSLGELQINED